MQYKTKSTCSSEINFDVVDDKVRNVSYTGGCSGNLKAIGKLVEGKKVDEVINLLEGINCGSRGTSCSDQLASALKEYKNKN